MVAGTEGAPLLIRSDGFGRIVEMVETPRIADDGTPAAHRQAWSTRFSYDARDLLVSIRDATGRTRRTAHDGLGRVIRIESPDFGSFALTYDDASNLIEEMDTRGRTTRYTYDGASRLISSDATASDAAPISTHYVYDLHHLGRLSQVADAFGTEELFYDKRGRMIEERRTVAAAFGGGSHSITRTFDPMDRLSSKTYPDGDRLTLAYDDRGLLTGARMAAVGDILLDAVYAPDEQPIMIHFANGIQKRMTYDARARLMRTELRHKRQDPPLFSEALIYDQASNIVSRERVVADKRSTENFDHDDLHRLVAVHRTGSDGDTRIWTYQYDRIGNLTEGTVDGMPIETAADRDETGRIVRIGELTIGWNAEGLLASARGPEIKVSNVYGYDGRRVLRRLTRSAEPEQDEFLLALFSDYELHGKRGVKFVNLFDGLAATVETPPPSSTRSSTAHYHHTSHLGSSLVRFDDTGTTVGSSEFAPFGAVETTHGVGSFGRGFTGAHFDAAVGITWFEARAMIPSTGRFFSPDPALIQIDAPPASPQALSPFSYAANRPLTHKDPDGRAFSVVVTAAFAGYDTYQYAVGNMTPEQYRTAMALNGAALAADLASGGLGGGLAIRAANLAQRSNALFKTARRIGGVTKHRIGRGISKASKSLFRSGGAVVAVIDTKKWGYLFGRAASSSHNLARSMQNKGPIGSYRYS